MRYIAIAASLAFAITATLALVPSAKAKDMLMSDGKCWLDNKGSGTGFHWTDCPKEKKATHHAAKAKGKGKEKGKA